MIDFDNDYLKELIDEAANESDRACALLLASNLDNRLKAILKEFLVTISNNYDKDLYEGNGPLATFSARSRIVFHSALSAEMNITT